MVGKPLYSRVNIIYSELHDCLASKESLLQHVSKTLNFILLSET
jgi:hypothetical protein